MENFPPLFLGKTLAQKEIPSYGGFDYPISMCELEDLKREVSSKIPPQHADQEYLIFLDSQPCGYDGGFELFLSAKAIIIPSLSKAQKDAIKLLKNTDSGILPLSSFRRNTLDFLLREKIFVSIENGVRLNKQIRNIV